MADVFVLRLQHVNKLACEMYSAPILGEWYSSVDKKRGRHNNDFGLMPATIDLDGASFDSDGACFDCDGARKRTFAPACCIEKCEMGGNRRSTFLTIPECSRSGIVNYSRIGGPRSLNGA